MRMDQKQVERIVQEVVRGMQPGAKGAPPATDAPVPVGAGGGVSGPVSKLGGQPVGQPVGNDPVPDEFRLGPGNEPVPGVVVRLALPEPYPGDFRLSPGNLQPVGVAGR